jgi:DNA-binding response OmpR family regulator
VNGLDRLSVILVEHDPWARAHLSAALGVAGLQASLASNGMTALRQALVSLPHVVIVGGRLPELSGPELIGELRSDPRTRHAAIVGVHGVVGADATLHLQCTALEVLAAIVEALEVRRQALAAAPMRSVSASPRGTWPLGATASSRSTSRMRNAGRSGKWRLSSGIETL